MREYGWQSFKGFIFRNPAVVDQDPRVDNGDENTERGNWTSKKEYILSMIGYAVGLGNIWRFPYLAYKNGGGAFLIPYFVMLVVVGIPLFFLESALGQFCSQGPVNVWSAVPLIQGIGVAMVVVSVIVSIYYNVIIAYSLYYMFASMQCPLPWSGCSSCDGSNCSTTPEVSCNVSSVLVTNWTQENSSCSSMQTSSELYWDNVALQRSSGLDETGPVVWHLALCLLLTSIIVTAALIKGIKSSGKVVYFTATFPYVVIVILLIRGVTLEGAKDGIEFYIGSQSNLTKLTEVQVWKDAATQTFYSLSIGWGGLIALASYNNFHNNVFKDSFVVTLTNAGTSVLAGFAIFSFLGHMAHVYKTPVSKVVKEGIYWVTLIDQFIASWVLLFLVLLEIIAICYIYGGNRFIKDIEMMIGMKTSTFWLWWRACWFFITPCIVVFLLISSLVYFEPPNYGGIPYPDWGMNLGWCMIAFVLMWIPVAAGYKLIKAKGNPWKRLKSLCSPSEEWHPYLDVHRGERYSEERCRRRNNSKIKAEVNLNVISSSWL
ncbi:sodium- and chloride-dependent neutral and basic amino acid transporter B(0+) isoform X3 [Astatotilapia calliptera]|uniref:sodium- and chloride-dependent neutral and basic amino acid transporter B(0+) isoform X3 n=1 Tax=Astatotilapia calliptera TaxID=8154 RepID=UPI000E42A9CB|nr:sodium- and chloride-dependent neutral and basic amino acid transporter B(0+) isoform X3 [Astatotilapia calliptera]